VLLSPTASCYGVQRPARATRGLRSTIRGPISSYSFCVRKQGAATLGKRPAPDVQRPALAASGLLQRSGDDFEVQRPALGLRALLGRLSVLLPANSLLIRQERTALDDQGTEFELQRAACGKQGASACSIAGDYDVWRAARASVGLTTA